MKTLAKFGMAMMIAIVFVGCRSNKGTVTNNTTRQGERQSTYYSEPMPLEPPCGKESYDDKQYFRALGTSRAYDMQRARTMAYQDAQSKIRMKIADISKAEATFEVEVVCEQLGRDMNGEFLSYIAIQVAKDSIQFQGQEKQ